MRNPVVRIDRNILAMAPGKVVKADTCAALAEAREIVVEARREADALRAGAEAERERARLAGREEGREEGRAELATALAEATGRTEAAFLGLEARIVTTVMNAVEEILGEIDDRTLMDKAIRRVLARAGSETRLRLRVADGDAELVEQCLTPILREHPDIAFVEVARDPRATAGTCVLETEFGVVDASLETQLKAVRAGLINAFVGQRQPAPRPPARHDGDIRT